MSFHLFFSGLACFVFCALLATIRVCARARTAFGRAPEAEPVPSPSRDSITRFTAKNYRTGGDRSVTFALCAALFAFWGIPPGSLPALFPFAWGGPAVLVCLALATGFEGAWRWNGETRRKTRVLALLALSLALLAGYARQRGVPGELLSLDSYVATLPAELMDWPGKLGMLSLAAAVLLAVRDVQQDMASGLACRMADRGYAALVPALMRQLWIFAALGMALCLFAPFCPSESLGMSGVAAMTADALFFWLKLLFADHLLWPDENENRRGRLCAWPQRAQFPLAACGALGIFFA